MKTKISILVPTIGAREAELRRLFESIIVQEYDNIEIIVVVQDNYERMRELCDSYSTRLNIIFLSTDKKGLSRARNLGLKNMSGDIVLLSDDDCWYKEKSINTIVNLFENDPDMDILLTQIFDPIANLPFKNYSPKGLVITKPFDLLSKSSVEVAFRRREPVLEFDELFGLGGKYVAAEENDYLIRCLKNKKVIQYEPIITVYHEKNNSKRSNNQLMAKGAFYAKNFGFLLSNMVLIRDLLIKRQNNYRWFWKGYYDYKKQN